MENLYQELIKRQEKELSTVPMFFATNDKQFKEGMEELGLTESDTDKICTSESGIYCKKSDINLLHNISKRHRDEVQEGINNDKTGEGFIYDMFKYELAYHLYSYTNDIGETLDALDLTIEEVINSKSLLNGLKKAIATIPCNQVV